MKHVHIAIIAFLLLPGITFAQNAIDKHFKQYKAQEDVTKIHITSRMFELAAHMELKDEDVKVAEFKKFISTIEEFNMIVKRETAESKTQYQSALKKIGGPYEELMSVEDKQGRFTLFIDESKGVVREVVMVGAGPQEFMVFSLTGAMDLKQLSRMAREVQSDGFQQMGRMFEHGVSEVKAYPNPLKPDQVLNIELPEKMIGGKASLISMEGKVVKEFSIHSKQEQMETGTLPAGSYVLKFSKGNINMKKRVILQAH